MQALRQRNAVERDHHQPAAGHPDDGTEHGLAEEFQYHVRRRGGAARNEFDKHQREENRKGIVGAGFRFQRRADTRPQPQAPRVHQQEYRCRVGRCHHGADQERLGPVQVKCVFGKGSCDQRGEEDPDGRQHHRGRQHRADALKPRSKSAVEQDQRQRHRSHQVGGADVVELELAWTGIAGQHADHQEHQ